MTTRGYETKVGEKRYITEVVISEVLFLGSRNVNKVNYKECITSPFWRKMKSSKNAAEMLLETWNKEVISLHESFKVILLNNNKVKGIYQLSKGGITGTLVDIRILFAVI